MSDPERPPLDPRVYDLIELTLYKIDQDHWSLLAEKQVIPEIEPPKSLRPPRVPNLLLNTLQLYAGNLFKAEADNYEQFRNNSNYAPWLSALEGRVIARIFRTIELIERANQPATLAYHGLTDDEISQGLSSILWQIRSGYIWGKPATPETSPVQNETQAILAQPVPAAQTTRRPLAEAYANTFPEAFILDICWAARQRYSEWKRWLRGVLKDGSAADRSFRAILTSGKSPQEYRKQPRPSGWK